MSNQTMSLAPPSTPNPNTPLAFLPPTLATQLEITRYVYVATIGAFVWDILTNVVQEYKLLFEHKITLPTIVYFISRIFTLAYIVSSATFLVAAVDNCQTLQVALGWFFAAGVGASSFLFFLRIYAIFNRQKIVVLFFFCVWLTVIAFGITVPFSIAGAHIGPTQYCINTKVASISSGSVIAPLINDTLVVFAISYQLVSTAYYGENGTWKERIRALTGKGNMPALSKSILLSGQQYYIITVAGNIASTILLLDPRIPEVFHAMLTVPNIALTSSMACRVHRGIKFGLMQNVPITTLTHPSASGYNHSTMIGNNRSNRRILKTSGTDTTMTQNNMPIEMTKVVETFHDHNVAEVYFLPGKSEGTTSRHSDGDIV